MPAKIVTMKMGALPSALIFLALLVMGATPARPENPELVLEVLAEEFPPFNYVEDGHLKGFTVDLVHEMLSRANLSPRDGQIRVLPWKRAYLRAQTKPDVLLLTTTRTEEREDLFQWVGPIYRREQWLYRRAGDEAVQVGALADLRGYSLVVVAQSANHQLLLDGGYGLNNLIYETSSIDSKIKMLLHGRAQIAPFLPLEVAHALSRQNLKPDSFEKLVKLSGRFQYYFALSRETSVLKTRLLQTALDWMMADGTYERILSHHLGGA